jgi:DNA polymerase III gamma/tau subunit
VAMLQSAIKNKSTQGFLFSGPSGIGKTTLARIVAAKLNCQLTEIDGATYTGVDKMREVVDSVHYLPFGEHKARAVLIDECHRISAQAWDSLLKAVEEPPPDVYWLLCTTNPDKVPKTIHTRVLHLPLKPLSRQTLERLVDDSVDRAGLRLAKDIKQLIVAEAHGSARQALVNIDACRDAKDLAQAHTLLHQAQASDTALQLCRLLAGYGNGGNPWGSAMRLVEKLLEQDADAEGLRIRICHYFAAAIRKADANKARGLLFRMEPFSRPYGGADAMPQLIRSIGATLFS